MHRWVLIAIYLIVAALLGPLPARGQQPDVLEIIRRSNDLLRGEHSYSELTMVVKTPSWTREYAMRCWTEGVDNAFILVTKPDKDLGTVFLKLGRQMWNYVPRVDKVIKIPPSMMLQSWMGSDFTNDDLARADSIVTDYEHRLLGREPRNNAECFKIESVPHEDAPVVWGKVLSWVDVDNFICRRAEFFDEDGALIKVLVSSDIRQVQGRWVSLRQVMTNQAKPGNSTSLTYGRIDFDAALPRDIFDLNKIKLPR